MVAESVPRIPECQGAREKGRNGPHGTRLAENINRAALSGKCSHFAHSALRGMRPW